MHVWNWCGLDSDSEPDDAHMKTDETLLERVGDCLELPTVRLYCWKSPAVTFGRLQSEESVRAAYPALPAYRRPTGGRAVIHNGDLTIAVATRYKNIEDHCHFDHSVKIVYAVLTNPLRETLKQMGMDTDTIEGQKRRQPSSRSDSLNCFDTIASCDIVEAKYGIKIVGSALRRTTNAVLLQMSVKPLPFADLYSERFSTELRTQFERYLNIGAWNRLRAEITS